MAIIDKKDIHVSSINVTSPQAVMMIKATMKSGLSVHQTKLLNPEAAIVIWEFKTFHGGR